MHRVTLAFLFALLATAARAQLGADEQACRQVWGTPVSVANQTNGTRVLTFSSGDSSIEIGLVSGVVRRANYGKPSLDKKEIARLLAMNSEGSEWSVWTAPGQEESGETLWTRPDEAAASLDGSGLTVTSREWLCPTAPPPPAASANSTATNAAPGREEGAGTSPDRPATVADIPFAGLWQCGGPSKPFTVLRIKPDGLLTWLEFGETERREIPLRWQRKSDTSCVVLPITEIPGVAQTAGSLVGALETDTSGTLHFTTPPAPAGQAARPVQRAAPQRSMAFNRIGAMPRWKPRAPDALPVNGDTKEEVVTLLGSPSGTMQSGGREVFVYFWGNVWFKNGVVDGVE